jgi:hypothetical protein
MGNRKGGNEEIIINLERYVRAKYSWRARENQCVVAEIYVNLW